LRASRWKSDFSINRPLFSFHVIIARESTAARSSMTNGVAKRRRGG
jgi:hypothetical protein